MRLNTSLLTSLFAAVFVLNIGLPKPVAAEALAPVSPPTPIPAFKISGLNGASLSDADLRNKVTIIRFWASW